MSELLPCPFCGETPDINGLHTFQSSQGAKWGSVVCCCTGPEVRTGYGHVDEWRNDAIEAWNTRALARRPDREEMRNALHEIVTNGEHTSDGGWKVSAEVYDLAYNADVFGAVEQEANK